MDLWRELFSAKLQVRLSHILFRRGETVPARVQLVAAFFCRGETGPAQSARLVFPDPLPPVASEKQGNELMTS